MKEMIERSLANKINLTPRPKPGGHYVTHAKTYWVDQIVGCREVDSPDNYDRLCYGYSDMENFVDKLVD